MAPSVPAFVNQALAAVKLAPVPGLAPAIEALQTCISIYEAVQTGRGACASLLERAADLLNRVNETMKEVEGNDALMQRSIRQLIACLGSVEGTLRLASKHNWVYWAFHQDDMARAIDDAQQSIDDGFRILGIKTDVAIYNQIQQLKFDQNQQRDEIIAHLNSEPKPSSVSLRDQELRTALRRLLVESSGDKENPVHQALKGMLGSDAEGDLPAYLITNYEVSRESVIHEGTYSVVRKGKWQNCLVAIKELTKEVSRDDLERQIAIWSGLRHENILQFYGVSTTSDVPFLVSPYLADGTVIAYIQTHPTMHRLRFIKSIASGMQYLHSRNFVHGNLQGENVLINASGNAVLAGFGLVKIKHDALSRSTDEAFKRRNSEAQRPWMSPERLMGKSTRKTDVWAFAMTTHEILSGRVPFDGSDSQTIRKYIVATSKEPIWLHLPEPSDEDAARGYSKQVRQLTERCLVHDAGSRPSFETINVLLSVV